MKLSSIALSNMRHNMKKYAMYFFAMAFSVFTIYSFLALLDNKSVQATFGDDRYVIVFITFAIVILVFVLFFLLSSNNSFIRSRKKEISTYALFGMQNSKIGKLFFLETMMIGSLALVTGIAFGIFFSKLTAMALLKLAMPAFTGNVTFSIGIGAALQTLVIFTIIFCFMGLSGLRVINKFKLVDLFKGEKVSEGKSKGSYVLLAISLILILGGYYYAFFTQEVSQLAILIIPILIIVIAGTYIFFRGGLQKILHLIKRNTKTYYKGTKLAAVSLLSHRAKTMAATMATITILVAIGTTAISFGHTLFRNAEDITYETKGFDVYFENADENLMNGVRNIIQNHGETITDEIIFESNIAQPEAIDIPENSEYYFEDNAPLRVYSQSQYNYIESISKSDDKSVSVKKGSAVIVDEFHNDTSWGSAALSFSDRDLSIRVIRGAEYSNGRYLTVVLNDEDYDQLYSTGDINLDESASYAAINYNHALNSADIAKDLNELLQTGQGSYFLSYNSYNGLLEIFGMVCFIGFFMCAVFILMTASMLYFKQVAMAAEEKSQYEMLRKIGVDTDTENKIITKRLLPMFLIPLLLGILHSVFAMKAADTLIFSNMIPAESSYISVLKTSGVIYAAYTLVYGVFYLVTKRQYKQTIK